MPHAFRLLYEQHDQSFVEENLLPLLEGLVSSRQLVSEYKVTKGEGLLLFVSDGCFKELLPTLKAHDCRLAILPHQHSPALNGGFGLQKGLKKVIEHLRTLEAPISIELLYCNDQPVLGHMVLGDTFQLMAIKAQGLAQWRLKLRLLKERLFKLKPFALQINMKNERHVRSIASGVIITQHRQSSLLARLIPGDSFIREALFHVFILSPRSLSELVSYTVQSLFSKNYFPSFGAHIKTDQLQLASPDGRPLRYTIDEEHFEASELNLEMRKQAAMVYPGPGLSLEGPKGELGEIYRLSSLPSGEAVDELSGKTLPLIKSASTEEFKDLFMILRENARLKGSYLVLMVLSTLLATFGLFANSTPVVIGAMILAPLMAPIISMSMATLRQERRLAMESAKTIFVGMGVAFSAAVFLTLITPISTANAEILARVHPTLLDLGVAVVSGIAGAYAHAREEIAKTLAGVAIAVALIPPLAVAAIGFGWWDFTIFRGASLLLFTNLAGMILAGSLTFLVLGFSPIHLARRGLLLSLFSVAALSLPLGFSFQQMVEKHQIIQQLSDVRVDQIALTQIQVVSTNPIQLRMVLVTDDPLSSDDLDQIKREVERLLKAPVVLEMSSAITR